MAANAQALMNYSEEIHQSNAVEFFRQAPRWPTAPAEFDFTLDYLTPVALTALIPIFFAVALALALVIHLTIRFTCRHSQTVARLERHHNSRRATLILIPLSAGLLMFTFVFTSLGLLGNATLNQSAKDALDVFEALVHDISRTGFAVVDTAIHLKTKLEAFSPEESLVNSTTDSPPALSETVGDMVTPAFLAMKTFVLDRYPDVSKLRHALIELRTKILSVFKTIRRLVGMVYSVLLAVILILVSALPLLRIATARSVPRICSLFAYLLYLFVPSLLAWALVGILSAVGATVSDVCASLTVYRDTLRGIISVPTASKNAFVASGFTCPEGTSGVELKRQIRDTAGSILQSELARTTVERLLSTPATDIAETANWTSDQLPRYLNCSAQVAFSGQLEFVVCGKEGRSAIDGIWNLWVAFIGLAICLSGALFASLMGLHVMRSFDVWAFPVHVGSDVNGGSEVEGGDGVSSVGQRDGDVEKGSDGTAAGKPSSPTDAADPSVRGQSVEIAVVAQDEAS